MALVQGGGDEIRLLQGCFMESDRSGVVAANLMGLCQSLSTAPHPHLLLLIDEVRTSYRLLRELADYSRIYFSRVPVVIDYLEIVLPCLSRTLRDIKTHVDDVNLTTENRWRTMYHKLTEEAKGLTLPQRFVLYNHFLTLLGELLTRSPNFDFNSMESSRLQLMQLREARSIPPPPIRVGSVIRPDMFIDNADQRNGVHWAEQIFSLPLSSRTALKHQETSVAMGPHFPWEQFQPPSDARVLFIRPFNDGQISLIVFISNRDGCPYYLLRLYYMGRAWCSVMGAHELCINREDSCLIFYRWSNEAGCAKVWAKLCCMTWEEMVLIYCSFRSFKSQNRLTIQLAPYEAALAGEKKLFQARIHDDNFRHSLIVYEDTMTKGLRLHAAVWDGELQQCPVWTAFITHQSASSTWIKQVSRCKVRLADIQLYVFCQKYRQQNQRRGSAGAFEICFMSGEATKRFKELFSAAASTTDGTTITESTES